MSTTTRPRGDESAETAAAHVREGDLVSRLRSGDADALASLYARHGARVHRHCFGRTASYDTADDLTSVVFLEAWRGRARAFEHDDSALPWLLGIATNVVRHQWRSSTRHRRAMSRLPLGDRVPDHGDDVAARVDDERRAARVVEALDTLSPAHREVLTLVVWEGLDYAGVAAAVGVPVGTVRSRLSRARAALAAALASTADTTDHTDTAGESR